MKASLPTYLVIGHVTEDLVPGGTRIGGSLSYSALTAHHLGESVGGITSANPELELPDIFRQIELIRIPSPATTRFENVYVGRKRKQFIRSLADKIGIDDIPKTWLGAEIVHLAPIAHEVSSEIIRLFPNSFVGATPQGWMRRWDADGRISKARWRDAEAILKSVDAVVLSVDDAPGGEKTIASYANAAKVLVATRGVEGADLYFRGRVHHFPAFPAKEVDPTGAGDVFAAAFFIKMHRSGDPFLSAKFANCAASLAVEKVGIEGIPTLEQINWRMRATA